MCPGQKPLTAEFAKKIRKVRGENLADPDFQPMIQLFNFFF